MNSKVIGAILLIVGTTIGAGMLALPVATAQAGFWGSVILLIACWGIMTACALLFLEVNMWLPPNSNLISMAGATLGWVGQSVAWFFYLLLLYSVISAYIAGGGDLLHYLLKTSYFEIPFWLTSILFTVALGAIVCLGIRSVDYVNRGLMFGKLGAFLFLSLLLLPFVSMEHLSDGHLAYLTSPTSVSVTALSFACLLIIPSLRTYLDNDVHTLRRVIVIGTLIPLFCYILWDMVIMGIIPLDGVGGLREILKAKDPNSNLVISLTSLIQQDTVTFLAKFFTSICMATSFLSVSLSLSDFLADGFRVPKRGKGNFLIFTATFAPPLMIVISNAKHNVFLNGLRYAGLSVFILMVFLPPLMAWRGRYHIELDQGKYRVRGGKFLLVLLVIFATLMIGFGIQDAFP